MPALEARPEASLRGQGLGGPLRGTAVNFDDALSSAFSGCSPLLITSLGACGCNSDLMMI